MYRDAELRNYQYYIYPTWMGASGVEFIPFLILTFSVGGLYASPSFSGSRLVLYFLLQRRRMSIYAVTE